MNNSTQRITDMIKQQAILVAVAALIIGILVGWFGIGWGLWPVDFVNGNLSQTQPSLQQDWVRLTAAEYALNPNIDRAATRIGALGTGATQVISDTITASKGDEQIRVIQLQQVLKLSGHLGAGTGTGTTGQPAAAPSLLDQFKLPLLACSLLKLKY